MEWLDFTMIEPIRLSCPSEPWERSPDPLESESRTERYRRKLQELTLDLEFDEGSDPDKSVA